MSELEIPANVYGVAMVLPSVLNRRKDGTCIFLFEHMRIWTILAGNYAIQLLFVHELWKMVNATREEQGGETYMACSNSVVVVQFVCLFVFEVAIFTEIRDSVLIVRLLWNTESPSSGPTPGTGWHRLQNSGDRRKSAAGAICTEPESKGRLSRWARKKQVGPSEWSLDGVSRCYRSFLFVVVGVPKLCVACLLMYFGGWYVLESPDRETLILNTLAMTFIINVDEFLYIAFTAQSIQDNINSMKPVTVQMGAWSHAGLWFANSIVYPAIIFLGSGCLTVYYKREACSYYIVPWNDPNYHLPWHMKFPQ